MLHKVITKQNLMLCWNAYVFTYTHVDGASCLPVLSLFIFYSFTTPRAIPKFFLLSTFLEFLFF